MVTLYEEVTDCGTGQQLMDLGRDFLIENYF